MLTLKKPPFIHHNYHDALNYTFIRNGVALNTNLDQWIEYKIDYTGPDVMVPHNAIKSALKADKKATLSSDGQSFIINGVSIKFVGGDLDNFPDKPAIEGEEYHIPGLASAIKKVTYSMPTKDVRSQLNGICLDITDYHINVVSTDGHRMHVCKLDYVKGFDGKDLPVGEYIIPSDAVKHVLCDSIIFCGKHLKIGNLITTIIDTKYPSWRRVVPNPKELATVDNASLLSTLLTLLPFTNTFNKCILDFSRESITISVDDNDTAVTLPAVCSLDCSIAFNMKYLIDVLKAEPKIGITTIGYTDLNTTILVNGDGVVMPIRK